MDQFWNALRDEVAKLTPGDELEIKGNRVAIVEASRNELLIHIFGRQQRYRIEALPVAVIRTLVNRSFSHTPGSKVVLGTFLAMDKEGDRARARLLWEDAAKQGNRWATTCCPSWTSRRRRAGSETSRLCVRITDHAHPRPTAAKQFRSSFPRFSSGLPSVARAGEAAVKCRLHNLRLFVPFKNGQVLRLLQTRFDVCSAEVPLDGSETLAHDEEASLRHTLHKKGAAALHVHRHLVVVRSQKGSAPLADHQPGTAVAEVGPASAANRGIQGDRLAGNPVGLAKQPVYLPDAIASPPLHTISYQRIGYGLLLLHRPLSGRPPCEVAERE